MERRERMTRHNLAVYRGHVANYICPQPYSTPTGRTRAIAFEEGLGHLRLRDVTARSVGEFRDELRTAGVSVPTVRKVLGTLQLILGHAVSLDLLAVNVARGVKVIGRRDEGSRKIVPPSKEALRQLLAAADLELRIRLIVASATGVRARELHALRWRHIDLKRGELTVETRVDAYRDEDVTKTVAGMRTIPLGAAVVTALREWRQRSAHQGSDDLVFPNRRGSFEAHDNMVRRRFLPLFQKLTEWHAEDPNSRPLPPARFNWHALRHFAVSCWIEAGLSPKTV